MGPRVLVRLSLVYIAVTLLMTLTINPYFSNGWDPQIFAQVGRAILDNNDIFDLYQVSRQSWGDWGYPYPPLYAHLLAPAIGLTQLVAPLVSFPDWLAVRIVPVIFDLTLALLLYRVMRRQTGDESLSRLAASLWLFNPLTLYQTAVQAHQESSWLVCVVAAYALLGRGGGILTAEAQGARTDPGPRGGLTAEAQRTQREEWRGSRQNGLLTTEAQEARRRSWRRFLGDSYALPSLLMALAVTLKQSAILFYIPYGVFLLLERERRWTRLVLAGVIFILVFGGLSLPYYLHSEDFFYLVFVDVANMPVQTQSAVVWLLGLKEYLIDQTRSDFFLLKYQSVITMALALVLSFLGLRRDRDMMRMGLLTALLFFLTSKKVMGYHYPLLLPFLLLYALPGRRFDLIGLAVLAASWIIVSPYFAPWARPERMALYAAIGTPNTILWLFLFVHVWRRDSAIRMGTLDLTKRLHDGGAVVLAITAVTVGMILSSWVQPLVTALPSQLKAPLVGSLCIGVIVASLAAALPVGRQLWACARLGRGHMVLAILLIPVYFAAFAMTQESTHIIETLLGGQGG